MTDQSIEPAAASPESDVSAYRPLAFAIAYRMVGSVAETEDIVQEAFLRLHRARQEGIVVESPKAYLSALTTRLAIDHLRSARVRRECYVGPWLPEPVIQEGKPAMEHQIEMAESLSMAFMLILEALSPVERAVFLLREVFEYDYAEIAQIVGKEEAACRQLFSRAKKHVAANRPRFKPSREAHRRLLDRFLRAVSLGELEGLTRLLREDVTMWADGGGKARGAATRPLHGREAVARFVLASTRLPAESYYAEIRDVNGEPALILRTAEKVIAALFLEEDQGYIKTIRAIGNPDKLERVQ
jgi:RNA polymerase sigma-70 factor, ECF subfamily